MSDVQVSSSSPIAAATLVTTDGSTIAGDGSLDRALRAIGGGSDLLPLVLTPSPSMGGTTALAAAKTNVTDLSSGGAQSFDLPLATSVPNGTLLVSIFLNAQAGSTLMYVPSGSDTLHAFNGGEHSFGVLSAYGGRVFVSDGVRAWWELR